MNFRWKVAGEDVARAASVVPLRRAEPEGGHALPTGKVARSHFWNHGPYNHPQTTANMIDQD